VLERRKFLKRIGEVGAAGLCFKSTPFLARTQGMASEEVLYNGIRLPSTWPPHPSSLSLEPMAVPYLASPPEIITIDVGRQLFVDDFLIERTTLRRTFHTAKYHPENPFSNPTSLGSKPAATRQPWFSATEFGTIPKTGNTRCGTWAAS
jgi:hypothetical protein